MPQIGLAGLERDALAERTRADAGGIEAVDHRQHRLDQRERRPQSLRDLEQADAQVAGLVDLVDQVAGDQQLAVRQRGAGLRMQMIVERKVAGDRGKVRPVLGEAAAGRSVQTQPAVQTAHAVRGAVVVERLAAIIDVERLVGCGVAGFDQAIGGGRLVANLAEIVVGCGVGRFLAFLAAGFEQGVAVDFLRDERLDFEVGQREQADRLLELRGHDQGLALAKIEARSDRHRPYPAR